MLFDRDNSVLLLIDFQPVMIKGILSTSFSDYNAQELINGENQLKNVIAVTQAAAIVDIPIIFTSIYEKGNGKFIPELTNLTPKTKVIERKVPGFNAIEDDNVWNALLKTKRTNVIICGLWTSMCFAFSAINLIEEGYQVFGLFDGCGDGSSNAHKYGIKRMTQAGVIPVTWMPVVSSWMHDWNDPSSKALVEKVFSQMH